MNITNILYWIRPRLNQRTNIRIQLKCGEAPLAALWVCKWCAAQGAHPSPKLLTDCTGRHNTINYYQQYFLENNGYTTKKSDLSSLDFAQKCSQNAGNAISETLNSKMFWQRIPPDPPLHVITVGAQNFFTLRPTPMQCCH